MVDIKKIRKWIEKQMIKELKEKKAYQKNEINNPFLDGRKEALESLKYEMEKETYFKKAIGLENIKIFMISKLEEIVLQRRITSSEEEKQNLYGKQDVYQKFFNEMEKENFNKKKG